MSTVILLADWGTCTVILNCEYYLEKIGASKQCPVSIT